MPKGETKNVDIDGLLTPYVRSAIDDTFRWPAHVPTRVIFDYEIMFVMDGAARITVENQIYDATPGDVFLFKPGRTHSIMLEKGGYLHQPLTHFDLFYQGDSELVKGNFRNLDALSPDEIRHIRKDYTAPGEKMELPDRLCVHDTAYFQCLLFDLIREWNSTQPFRSVSVNCAFLRLWSYILQENHLYQLSKGNAQLDKYTSIKRYIEQNLNRSVSLDELSNHFFINKYYLRRTFIDLFGFSPAEYGRMMRIRKARDMICYTNASISEIASRLGFKSMQAFYHTFHLVDGSSPGSYRTMDTVTPRKES